MTTKEAVYRKLREQIITQQRKGGSILDEKTLMREFNIGRTPLREVFIELQSEELVTTVPRVGTFVTNLEIGLLRSDIEIRGRLEEIVVSLLLIKMSDVDLEKFKEMLDMGATFRDKKDSNNKFSELLLYETDIHQFLYECTRNEILPRIMKQIQAHSLRYWHVMSNDFDLAYSQFNSLYDLYEALKARDSVAARKCAHKHVEDFEVIVKEHLLSSSL